MPTAARRTFNRTKLVATIGPATEQPESIAALLDTGVDVCRLNFSHGELERHRAVFNVIRAWEREHGRPVAVLGDLCGPKIRLTAVAGGSFELRPGDTIRLAAGEGDCDRQRLCTNYPGLLDELRVGQRVYIDDGAVRLLAVDREPREIVCTCTTGGVVSSRKGVNLPDTALSTPALTEKDRRDLRWAVETGLDYVALSFVRTPSDLRELRGLLREQGSDLHVVVKIEKSQALEHLDELIGEADAAMVARGDLGVEMDPWQVPLVQKSLIARCREAGKPVIVATQMLQSMVAHPVPTRAEVSDVANAIFEGADAVMLSAETAAGQFPLAAVEVMARVAEVTEAYQATQPLVPPASMLSGNRRTSAIAQAAVQAAAQLHARLVAVWTASGETARQVARHRLPIPVVGLTFDERVYRRLALLYGVYPMRIEALDSPRAMAERLDACLLESGLSRRGDFVIVVTSTTPNTPGATDMVVARRVGEAGAT
ncbi:MAG: pyruvate kinase [Phycisphaerae bacterium]|jgi:pyruvate kinase